MRVWSADALASVLQGDDCYALVRAFRWADTPQGHVYWSDRVDGRAPLSDEDRDYLGRLYADAIKRRLGLGS